MLSPKQCCEHLALFAASLFIVLPVSSLAVVSPPCPWCNCHGRSCWAPVAALGWVGKAEQGMTTPEQAAKNKTNLTNAVLGGRSAVAGLQSNEKHSLPLRQGKICCWVLRDIKLTLALVLILPLLISLQPGLYMSLWISKHCKICTVRGSVK